MNEDNAIIFCVYGTLRQGWGNHRLLAKETVEYLGEFRTPPAYTLESLGGCPAVHCEGTTSVVCELYKTTDQQVIQRVFGLEGYSGTPTKDGGRNGYDVEPIQTPHGEALMFVFRRPVRNTVVASGDWNDCKRNW